MRDELFDRGYQDGREDLHAGIDRLVERLTTLLAPAGRASRWNRRRADCAGLA